MTGARTILSLTVAAALATSFPAVSSPRGSCLRSFPAVNDHAAGSRSQPNVVSVLSEAQWLTQGCRFAASRSLLMRSLQIFTVASDRSEVRASIADNDRAWASCASSHGNYRSALDHVMRASESDPPGSEQWACDQLALGQTWSALGDDAVAQKCESAALKWFVAVQDNESEARALNEIALSRWRAGRYPAALSEAKAAESCVGKTACTEVSSDVQNTLGIIFRSLGDYEHASTCFRNAAAAATLSADDRIAAESQGNLGALDHSLGLYRSAANHYQSSLPLLKATNDVNGQATIHSNLGYAEYFSGDVKRARLDTVTAIKLWTSLGDDRGIQAALSNLGRIDAEQGRLELASDEIERAAALSEKSHDPAGQGICETDLALVSLEGSSFSLAARHAARALVLLRKAPDPFLVARAESMLMRIFEAMGKPATATMWGKLAVNCYQSLAGSALSIGKADRAAFTQSHASAYRDLADVLMDQGRLSEAERVMRLLKGEELREFECAPSSGPRADDGRRDAEVLVRAPLPPLRGEAELARSQAGGPAISGANAGEADGIALSDLELRTAYECLGSASYRVAASRVLASDLGRPCASHAIVSAGDPPGPDRARIYTLVTAREVRVIVETSIQSACAVTVIPESSLSRLVGSFRQALADPTSDSREVGKALYDLLLPNRVVACLTRAKVTEISWSLDGVLRYVPVAALYDGSHFAVERWGSVLAFPCPTRLDPQESVGSLIAGSSEARTLRDPLSGDELSFAALPSVEGEMASVEAFSPLPSSVLLNRQFTLSHFQAGLADGPAIVHIATHFHLVAGNDALSFLLLGDGSLLTLGRVASMNHAFSGVRLVTLSACSTGVCSGDGKEVDGLAGICAEQGARHVLSTLWEVSDPTTAHFMKSFYALRPTDGVEGVAESVREAQLEMLGTFRKSRASFGGASSWSPYIVYEAGG